MNRTRVFFVCLLVLHIPVCDMWAQFDFSNSSWAIPIDSNQAASANFSNGIAIQDINFDGFDDIAVAENNHGISIWLSNGSGFSFLSFVELQADIKQICFVDVDNDHDLELFASAYGGGLYLFESIDLAYWQLVQNTFSEYWGFYYGASWTDYDKDGDLDVFVCQYVDFLYSQGMPNLFFENMGGYNFVERSNELGLSELTNNSFQSVWFDFNHDGWMDLYVINDHDVPNLFYRNVQGEYFVESGHDIGADISMFCMSNSISDFNNDGEWNIFMTDDNDPVLLDLTENQTYINVADSLGLDYLSNGWGALWIDVDYDGDEDLHIAQGWIGAPENNLLYLNQGSGFIQNNLFDTIPFSSFINAKGDFNNDGRWDLVIRNEFPSKLQIGLGSPDTATNWVKINLEGAYSNYWGIGSVVQVYAGGVMQQFINHCGENYIAQNCSSTIVGLNDWSQIDSLMVVWPNSTTEKWYNLDANQTYLFVEGSSIEADTLFLDTTLCSGEEWEFNLPNGWYIDNLQSSQSLPLNAGVHLFQIYNQWGWNRPCQVTATEYPTADLILEEEWNCNLGMYVIEWIGEAPVEVIGFNYPTDTLAEGSNLIIWKDNHGCWQESQINLNSVVVPEIHLNMPDTICVNDSVPLDFSWQNGFLPQWIVEMPDYVSEGSYEIVFSDSMGCIHTNTFTIQNWNIIAVSYEVVYQNEWALVSFQIDGGDGPFQIEVNGEMIGGFQWTHDAFGDFSFHITDANGCEFQGIITVNDWTNIGELHSDFNDINRDKEGKVFESSGKLIYQGKMSEFFNSSGLSISPGFYVISVGTNTYKWIKK